MDVEDREENIHQTYLALRVAMVMLVAMLFLAILLQLWFVNGGQCWQTSISAYYFTSVRPVFVCVLCAIGACMIVYRGNTDYENTALDYSGFLAFIVAFVPTKIDDACLPVNGPDRPEIEAAVKTNVGALLVIGVAATIVGLIARRLRHGQLESPSLYTVVSLLVTLAVLLFGIWLYWNERNWFLDHGHIYAAVPLFIGIIVVVLANAWTAPQGKFTIWYIAVAIAMIVSLLAGGILWRMGVQHWALWLEALIIFWYAVFWVVQTAELRGATNRAQVG
ncbi:hypothetical protein [Amycolatopsis sp. NPDC051371]|uniref:hypothetical protein n=1 Tax=Amycolatopsis sp. NPDC051371 TaxID=3155800 RepID=UPI0034356D16